MFHQIKTWMIMGVIACCLSVTPVGWSQDVYDLTIQGADLTAAQAEQLEARLDADPADVSVRTQLLGYYWRDRLRDPDKLSRQEHHVLYLIEHAPGSAVLGHPEGTLMPHFNPRGYGEGSRMWERHLADRVDDVALLRNAANYWSMHERDRATAALKRGIEREPTVPDWAQSLGHLTALNMIGLPEAKKPAIAAEALDYFEQAYALSDPMVQSYLLSEMCDMALTAGLFERAAGYAKQMLAEPMDLDDWNAGNSYHVAHQVLGSIALAKDDIDTAVEHLLESGRTPGSPQLDSFGPQMRLAKQLLDAGQADAVTTYLDLCSQFWEMGRDEVTEWKASIRAGREPDWDHQMVY